MTRSPIPQNFIQASQESNLLSNYMPGFGNDFETETLPESLPQFTNTLSPFLILLAITRPPELVK